MFKITYKRIILANFLGGLAIFISGISIMPPTGGAAPINETSDQYYQGQRSIILNSDGFKMIMAGSAIIILSIIILVRHTIREENENETIESRPRQVVPYPQVQPQVQPKVQQELEKVVVVKEYPRAPEIPYNLYTQPFQAMAPMAPTTPVLPFRKFKYPPPYEAFNKK